MILTPENVPHAPASRVACVGVDFDTARSAPTTAPRPATSRGFKETLFIALPRGILRAAGWLLKQLDLQRAVDRTRRGSVRRDQRLVRLAGQRQRELGKGPYYINGLMPLAYTLEDEVLKHRAQKWIDWALQSRQADSFTGSRTTTTGGVPGFQDTAENHPYADVAPRPAARGRDFPRQPCLSTPTHPEVATPASTRRKAASSAAAPLCGTRSTAPCRPTDRQRFPSPPAARRSSSA